MMPAYPEDLRPMLALNREQMAVPAYTPNPPLYGARYYRPKGADAPTIWSAEFRFGRDDAIRFRLWYETIINRGLTPFTVKVRTATGLLDHTMRFMAEGGLVCDQSGVTFTYRAKLLEVA